MTKKQIIAQYYNTPQYYKMCSETIGEWWVRCYPYKLDGEFSRGDATLSLSPSEDSVIFDLNETITSYVNWCIPIWELTENSTREDWQFE